MFSEINQDLVPVKAPEIFCGQVHDCSSTSFTKKCIKIRNHGQYQLTSAGLGIDDFPMKINEVPKLIRTILNHFTYNGLMLRTFHGKTKIPRVWYYHRNRNL